MDELNEMLLHLRFSSLTRLKLQGTVFCSHGKDSICAPFNDNNGSLFARVALLTDKNDVGFNLQPASLQSVLLHELAALPLKAFVPSGMSLACLPTVSSVINAAAYNRNQTILAADWSHNPAAAILDIMFWEAQQFEPSLAKPAYFTDMTDIVYTFEWQAADTLFFEPQHPSLVVKTWPCRGSLGMSQSASVAAATAVQVLHKHKEVSLATMTLHATGSLEGLFTGQIPAVASGAMAGILKNLPYEMPFLTSDLQFTDPARVKPVCGLSTDAPQTSLETDLFGFEMGGGATHRPLLTYSTGGSADQSSKIKTIANARTYAITGGLGGLGLLTASWMAGCGASALVLLSRSGIASTASTIAKCSMLALVVVAKSDVSFNEDAHLMADVTRGQQHCFGGIMHTAGLQVGCSS